MLKRTDHFDHSGYISFVLFFKYEHVPNDIFDLIFEHVETKLN